MKNVNIFASKTNERLKKFVYGETRQGHFFGKRKDFFNKEVEDLSKWIRNDAESVNLFSVCSNICDWSVRNYILEVLAGKENKKQLYLAQQAQSIEFRCAATLHSPDSVFYVVPLPRYADLLSRTIVLGWEDEAEFLARVGFNDLGGVLGGGVYAAAPLPWFVLELVKDWLGAKNVNLTTPFREEYVEDLGPWQGLLEEWREPDLEKFERRMFELAERHVVQSEDKYTCDVRDVAYWVWPIELLAVLRLREWIGLSNPEMTHPLFSVASLGRLEPPLERQTDPLLDAAFARFRGEERPRTMAMNNLSGLRDKQGTRL